MKLSRPVKLLSGVAMVAGIAAAVVATRIWLTAPAPEPAGATDPRHAAPPPEIDVRIIVGEQAQANLALTAKQLKAESFWKTITIQGMVVDRPGVSEQQVVAPTTGIVTQILHVPGETVQPGELLFKLKLSSEVLHETQTDLFKASQEIQLAKARLDRLVSAGEGVPQVRVIEVESEIARLETAVKAARHELMIWGFSAADVDGVAQGKLVSEIPLAVPGALSSSGDTLPTTQAAIVPKHGYEVQQLSVAAGQQVQSGEVLCVLANHESMAIESRAFRDETALVEKSIEGSWPVEVDFQEADVGDWPSSGGPFTISHLVNTVDPVTRTFAFFVPLENQSKLVERDGSDQLLWRFRPGQKVRLYVRVQELHNVFVLPADAVVREGGEAYVFTQNANTFERKPVHVVFHDRDQMVLANDGSLPVYKKGQEFWTVAAVVRNAAPQLNRMAKAGSSEVPKGFHIHADGSLHRNEDEGK